MKGDSARKAHPQEAKFKGILLWWARSSNPLLSSSSNLLLSSPHKPEGRELRLLIPEPLLWQLAEHSLH